MEEKANVCETSDAFTSQTVHQSLKNLTENLKDEGFRLSIDGENLGYVVSIVQNYTWWKRSALPETDGPAYALALDILTECFRAMRNACAGCPKNQLFLDSLNAHSVTQNVVSDLRSVLNNDQAITKINLKERLVVALRCAAQFVGNLITGQMEMARKVYGLMREDFVSSLSLSDTQILNYTCRTMHVCLRAEVPFDDCMVSCVERILCHLYDHDIEWGIFVIAELLLMDASCEEIFPKLSDKSKSSLLDICLAHLKSTRAETSPVISTQNLKYLSSVFQDKSHIILGLHNQEGSVSLEPVTLLRILEILCIVLSTPEQYMEIKEDGNLVKCCVNLLHATYMIGQQGDNAFTSVEKLGAAAQVDPGHPSYGLKRDLIRLIGNMCHRHKINQDNVRELGGIQLILNHTNIDKRNPYIPQWAILAIKHLCEDNAENQAIIAGMKLEGVANQEALFRELGIQTEVRDGKVHVKQMKKL